jgi:hypothetical protein
MIFHKPLLLAVGLSALAALFAVRNARHYSQQKERNLHKTQLNTWEGEGGNPAPRSPT